MSKQYEERDIATLDKDGGHYFRHVSAMTAEKLHSKSDIAAELAWRDFHLVEKATDLLMKQRRINELEAALSQSIEAMVSELNERGHITEGEIHELRTICNGDEGKIKVFY